MKQKLEKCIQYLTIAKESVAKDDADPTIALEFLVKSQELLNEFMQVSDEEKAEHKETLLEIQALGQFINRYLADNKVVLQKRVLQNNKMASAIKGYKQ